MVVFLPMNVTNIRLKEVNNIKAESTILMLKVDFSQAVITYFRI